VTRARSYWAFRAGMKRQDSAQNARDIVAGHGPRAARACHMHANTKQRTL